MPDDLTPTVATFNPADLAATSAEQLAAFGAVLKANGHSAEAVDKALTVTPGAPALPPDSIKLPEPDALPLSADETRKAADMLRKHWTGDPAELEAELKKLGIADKPAAEQPADPHDAELARAAAAMEPPASASEYEFNWQGIDAPVAIVAKADGMLREAFVAAEVPKVLGKGLARALVEASLHRAEGEAGIAIRVQEIRATLNNMTGGKAADVIAAANRVLGKMPGDVASQLTRSDAVADVQVLLMLQRVDSLSAARAARKAK